MSSDQPQTTENSDDILPEEVTADTYAGMAAARDGVAKVPPADLSGDRAEEWLWGYHAWGAWSILARPMK